jgi:hypothetical protein
MKYLVFLFWLCIAITTFYLLNKGKRKNDMIKVQRVKIDSLQKAVDSLHAENYPCQIELSRYQRAYEILSERNPDAASEYGDIISNETE